MPDYYAILEVSPAATQAEIKRSYRRLVRQYHPDLNQQALDNQIKLLNEAYAVLSDPERRAAYDARRRAAKERRTVDSPVLRHQQEQAKREPRMTWAQGVIGFVRELKKGLQE